MSRARRWQAGGYGEVWGFPLPLNTRRKKKRIKYGLLMVAWGGVMTKGGRGLFGGVAFENL